MYLHICTQARTETHTQHIKEWDAIFRRGGNECYLQMAWAYITKYSLMNSATGHTSRVYERLTGQREKEDLRATVDNIYLAASLL